MARWGLAACLAATVLWSTGSGAAEAVRKHAKLEEYARATAWLVGQIPPGSKVLAERYTPSLPEGLFEVYVVGPRGTVRRLEQPRRYLTPDGCLGKVGSARRALERVDYLVIGSLRRRYERERERYRRESGTYDALVRGSKRVARRGQYEIRKVKGDPVADQGEGDVRSAPGARRGKKKRRTELP